MNYETTTTKNKSEKEPFFLVQREDLYLHKLLKQIQFYKKHSGVKMYHNQHLNKHAIICKSVKYIFEKKQLFFFQYTFDLMVTNIHVYNVIGNREDCLVNTHHCRCSGVYHLDWRVLDQVNISILDIDLRICEIKLHDFMTSALF